MFSAFRSVISTCTRVLPAINTTANASFHSLITPYTPKQVFLAPQIQNVVPSCGMKVMMKVRRRCKDCYFVWREERLYNMCKKHPRHKQMSTVKKEKNTWILSHATQGKIRPW